MKELKISEHQLMTLMKNYLQAKGYYVMRLNSGMIRDSKGHGIRLNEVGTPDLMAFKKPNYFNKGQVDLFFIEVKTPQNPNPTLLQKVKMQELEEHGARCIVARSLEELQEGLSYEKLK